MTAPVKKSMFPTHAKITILAMLYALKGDIPRAFLEGFFGEFEKYITEKTK
jgi:hypothetical protein